MERSKLNFIVSIFFRNLSRAIIIQFTPIQKVYVGKEKVDVFIKLHAVERSASSSIGQLILLGRTAFQFSDHDQKLYESVSTLVSELLQGQLLRMADTYSIWLYATIKVSIYYYYVTSSAKRGLIRFLVAHIWKTMWIWYKVPWKLVLIYYEGDSLKTWGAKICQSLKFRAAKRSLFCRASHT